MPNPTRGQMHQSRPLTELTVGNQQDDENFILRQLGPFMPVEHKKDDYYVYDDGDWNRMEMQPRGPSQESEGTGWRLSTESFSADRYACHKDFDWTDEDDADDALDTDSDASDFMSNQGRIYGDFLLGSNVFAPAVWTTDLDGTTGAVTVGTNFKQWDDAAGDPQADIIYYSEVQRGLMGHEANMMVVGAVAHARLLTNATVRDHIKYTSIPTKAKVRQELASYFGVDKYLVAGAYRTTSAETATKAISYILDSKAAWIGYVNPEIGKRKMTSFRTFAYKDGGRASDGVVVRTIDMPWITSTRYEIETFWDVKVINADGGVFFDAAVA